ncbi:MAG: alpha/beta fold hydrolase [Phycisphaerae bacterium]|nr:alpha/beta fold hydrolase [Phycisphaerae bacterium]
MLLEIIASVEPPWIVRHWAALVIVITCLSLLGFMALVLAKYVRICLNIFVDTPPPLSMGPVDFTPLHGDMIRFRSFDGTSLRGMHLRPKNRTEYKGTILFCHEYGSDMFSCARYARPLIEAGFDVFTFDYRGHGDSSNRSRYKPLQWPSDKEQQDTLGALAYVEAALTAEGKSPNVGIFGISRGAGSALLAACSTPNVKAILCDGVFSTELTIISFMKRWARIFASVKLVYENHTERFWQFLYWLLIRFAQPKLACRYPSVRKALMEMRNCPTMFVYGQRDSYIREDQTRALHAMAPEPKYLWIVKGAKHNQAAIVEPRQYAARSIAFFRKHLAEENVAESEITDPADTEAEVA